jgi:predicted nucleic acid-binding protein
MVLDASAVVEWLLRLPLASAVSERLLAADALHAPHLLAVEVTQVVRRYVAAGELGEARGAEALVDLADLDVIHHPTSRSCPSCGGSGRT